MIRRGPGFARAPGVSQSAVWIYEKALIPWLTKQLPKEYLQITEALGEGSGVRQNHFCIHCFSRMAFCSWPA